MNKFLVIFIYCLISPIFASVNNNQIINNLMVAVKVGDIDKTITILASNKENKEKSLDTLDMINIRDREGFTALMHASRYGQSEITAEFLNRGANPNLDNRGITALMLATMYGRDNIVIQLLSKEANPNLVNGQYNLTALMYAARHGHIKIVKILLANGANFSVKDINGNTALALAKKYGHINIASILEAVAK